MSKINKENLISELDNFLNLTKNNQFYKLDEYCFATSNHKLDLLISALIHGDEVIGIQVINNFLRSNRLNNVNIEIGFLLGNLNAYFKNLRYIESDLNRSFSITNPTTLEEKRAKEISEIVKKSKFIIDIHQTIEPTLSPFFIFPHHEKLIQMANFLLPDLPIVTFAAEGFSKNGKTMIEYALENHSFGLAIECGQKGFNAEMSTMMQDILQKLISKLSTKFEYQSKEVTVFQITQTIDYFDGDELLKGLNSHQKVLAGDILGKRVNGDPIISPVNGYIYFPKYGDLAKSTKIFCEIAEPKKVLV